ncbi:uncharacterized protein LAESUDRAFT_723272, partial [Laetiporus sulphureus 93-53]
MSQPLPDGSFEPSVPDKPSTPGSIQRLKALLRKTLRVTIQDGRIFLGTFVGTDKHLNILLVNSEEYRIGPDAVDGDPNGRFVGQILVPWRLVQKVEVGGPNVRQPLPTDEEDESLYA